jgi:hypothetical protein
MVCGPLAVERHTQAQDYSNPQTCENLGDLPDDGMQRSEDFAMKRRSEGMIKSSRI